MNTTNQELAQKLSNLQWLIHRLRMTAFAAHGPMADTSRGQGRVLALLRMRDGVSTKDLSYLLGIRTTSLNELLSKLEKGGYITREPMQEDKRVMLIKLTEKGRSEQEEPEEQEDLFGCLTEEERANLGDYLDRILTALAARVGDEPDEADISRMRAARERMGDEMFDRLRGRRGWGGPHGGCGHHGHHGPFGPRGPHGGFGPHGRSCAHGDFDPRAGLVPRGEDDEG